jgi:hypothetical protein
MLDTAKIMKPMLRLHAKMAAVHDGAMESKKTTNSTLESINFSAFNRFRLKAA